MNRFNMKTLFAVLLVLFTVRAYQRWNAPVPVSGAAQGAAIDRLGAGSAGEGAAAAGARPLDVDSTEERGPAALPAIAIGERLVGRFRPREEDLYKALLPEGPLREPVIDYLETSGVAGSTDAELVARHQRAIAALHARPAESLRYLQRALDKLPETYNYVRQDLLSTVQHFPTDEADKSAFYRSQALRPAGDPVFVGERHIAFEYLMESPGVSLREKEETLLEIIRRNPGHQDLIISVLHSYAKHDEERGRALLSKYGYGDED